MTVPASLPDRSLVPRPQPGQAEYEFRNLYLPRGTSRSAARRILTDEAEYGRWELDRVRMTADGTRFVRLRRKVIRAVRTA